MVTCIYTAAQKHYVFIQLFSTEIRVLLDKQLLLDYDQVNMFYVQLK